MSDIENQLNELKLERERLEGDLKKSREQKLKELEKIDRALEKKEVDNKENKGLTNNNKLYRSYVAAFTISHINSFLTSLYSLR